MLSKVISYLSLLSVIIISGLPLALIQMGAWISMFEEFYEETDSIGISVEWTFGGDHPCDICNFVTDLKDSKKEIVANCNISSKKLNLSANICEFTKSHDIEFLGKLYSFRQAPSNAYFEIETPPPRLKA